MGANSMASALRATEAEDGTVDPPSCALAETAILAIFSSGLPRLNPFACARARSMYRLKTRRSWTETAGGRGGEGGGGGDGGGGGGVVLLEREGAG